MHFSSECSLLLLFFFFYFRPHFNSTVIFSSCSVFVRLVCCRNSPQSVCKIARKLTAIQLLPSTRLWLCKVTLFEERIILWRQRQLDKQILKIRENVRIAHKHKHALTHSYSLAHLASSLTKCNHSTHTHNIITSKILCHLLYMHKYYIYGRTSAPKRKVTLYITNTFWNNIQTVNNKKLNVQRNKYLEEEQATEIRRISVAFLACE